MSLTFNYLPIDSVSVGEGSISDLKKIIVKEERDKGIIITNKSVSETQFFKTVSGLLVGSKIYNNITQHSLIEEIKQVAEEVKGKDLKYIVSVGGGSVIDSAKVLRYTVDVDIPQIAIPTTLSAAEFSHIAGYTENGEKKGIRDKNLVPRHVILDSAATLETPTTLWRSTGVRAMDHAIESTLDDDILELRLQLSRMAVEKLFSNLIGNWTDKRQECQVASWYSYMDVFDSEMGYSHQIGKIIGAKWNIPHGITSCITLPEILRYYSAEPPKGLASLANALAGANEGSKSTEALADRVEEFINVLGVKKKLSDYGIEEKDLDYIMEKLGTNDEELKGHLTSML